MQTRILTITILILAAILIIGFTFYQYFKDANLNQEDTVKDVIDAPPVQVSPEEVVEKFYEWYKTTGGIDPTVASSSPYLTNRFANMIMSAFPGMEKTTSIDPLTCSESFPDNLLIRPAHITTSGAQVAIDANIAEKEISFIVELVELASIWRIDAVVCFEKG